MVGWPSPLGLPAAVAFRFDTQGGRATRRVSAWLGESIVNADSVD